MPLPSAAFAIPGDIETKSGGFIYERRLLLALRDAGREVAHLQLPAAFPDPTPDDVTQAADIMAAVAEDVPLIVDGLVFGAIPTEALARVRAPICAMIHHPLALESGLTADRAAELERQEAENLRLAAHILVPSPHTAEVLVTRYGARAEAITIAPPGFDRPTVTAPKAEPPLILSVGVLHPRKGHDILIEALTRIADLPWQARIVGPDYHAAHAAELHRQHAESGLSDRLRFRGPVGPDELQALYGSATIFALASRYEGYGMVFGEALCQALPIVACRAGAVPDTVPRDAGLLVPVDDPEAFAAALRRLLMDSALRGQLSAAAARAGAALPTWPDTAAIAGAVLDRLAERGGA